MLTRKNKNLATKILTTNNYVENLLQKLFFPTQVALNPADHRFALHEPKRKVFPANLKMKFLTYY
ncbi:hypothetical protein [Nostoc sp. UHCC 0252]|uniref:hypothetical protein n=1 Tax=Nostoc sp. UHCC 0252 TaxID=3110241 RepID=UPI002B2024A8|nr:hypothetical protein [Nostoc sp. UHCC 0252]MEA5606075.1 hypothetical protein [Nostoc sp. UHCC 0252]